MFSGSNHSNLGIEWFLRAATVTSHCPLPPSVLVPTSGFLSSCLIEAPPLLGGKRGHSSDMHGHADRDYSRKVLAPRNEYLEKAMCWLSAHDALDGGDESLVDPPAQPLLQLGQQHRHHNFLLPYLPGSRTASHADASALRSRRH